MEAIRKVDHPLVSVVISTYNSASTIRDVLESLLKNV
ncbi:MAG: glycosyltransferase [Thermofilum sp.]